MCKNKLRSYSSVMLTAPKGDGIMTQNVSRAGFLEKDFFSFFKCMIFILKKLNANTFDELSD